jgi:hypothetical protein
VLCPADGGALPEPAPTSCRRLKWRATRCWFLFLYSSRSSSAASRASSENCRATCADGWRTAHELGRRAPAALAPPPVCCGHGLPPVRPQPRPGRLRGAADASAICGPRRAPPSPPLHLHRCEVCELDGGVGRWQREQAHRRAQRRRQRVRRRHRHDLHPPVRRQWLAQAWVRVQVVCNLSARRGPATQLGWRPRGLQRRPPAWGLQRECASRPGVLACRGNTTVRRNSKSFLFY